MPVNAVDQKMNTLSEEITKAQTVCALRFQGYEYEEATGIAVPGVTGGSLSRLIEPVVETLNLHTAQEDNFAAFFGLQRYLFKWGGEYLDNGSKEYIAFDFLFLHLYRLSVPARFSNEEYVSQWNREFMASAEAIAGGVRGSFRRKA